MMNASTSFRGAKHAKFEKKSVFLAMFINIGQNTMDKSRKNLKKKKKRI